MQLGDLKKDFFTFLGIPTGFDIDIAVLDQHYRTLQKQLHPDKFAVAPEAEKRMAMQLTAHLNEAYTTLKSPLDRGRYLLSLQGVDTNEELDTAMPKEFLMEQMELREQLDEVDNTDNPMVNLEQLRQLISEKSSVRVKQLSDSFGQHDLKKARNIVRELQFLDKIAEEIEHVEERLLS